MTPYDFLYEISSDHSDPVNIGEQWRRDSEGKTICRECKSIFPSVKHLHPQLKSIPKDMTTGIVFFYKMSIHCKSLIKLLGPLPENVICGPCYGCDKKLIPTHELCFSHSYLPVFSDEGTKYYDCFTCKKRYTFVHPNSPKYVSDEFLDDRQVYMDQFGGFLISDRLADKLDFSGFPDLILNKIEIRRQ